MEKSSTNQRRVVIKMLFSIVFSDGKRSNFADKLLPNELNVLLTRGVHGLYLHAVDPALQKALEDAAGENRVIE